MYGGCATCLAILSLLITQRFIAFDATYWSTHIPLQSSQKHIQHSKLRATQSSSPDMSWHCRRKAAHLGTTCKLSNDGFEPVALMLQDDAAYNWTNCRKWLHFSYLNTAQWNTVLQHLEDIAKLSINWEEQQQNQWTGNFLCRELQLCIWPYNGDDWGLQLFHFIFLPKNN